MLENTIYYIYHIKGRKIGCSKNVYKRIKSQLKEGEEWEILEEHIDIKLASNRELELQILFNYTKDNLLYYKTLNNQSDEGRSKSGKLAVEKGTLEKARNSINRELQREATRKVGLNNVKTGHIKRIRQIAEETGVLDKVRKINGKNNVINGHLKNISEKNKKQIKAINLKTKQEIIFESIKEASNYFNVCNSNIVKVLKGVYKSSCGHTFIYINNI